MSPIVAFIIGLIIVLTSYAVREYKQYSNVLFDLVQMFFGSFTAGALFTLAEEGWVIISLGELNDSLYFFIIFFCLTYGLLYALKGVESGIFKDQVESPLIRTVFLACMSLAASALLIETLNLRIVLPHYGLEWNTMVHQKFVLRCASTGMIGGLLTDLSIRE